MKAVVLVGGEGTRLRPLTLTTPKALLPIANQPYIERQLAWLGAHGVDEVVLSMGYLPDAFHAHFGVGGARERFGDVRIRYAVEDEPLGTAGAIRFAADGIDERFVVCNSDILTDLDLSAMVRFHDERNAEATISLTRVDDPSAFGVVPTRPDGEVIAFVEKPPAGNAPTDWINAGTYVLEPSFLERVTPRRNVSIERETFPGMLTRTGRLYGFSAEGYWIDIGTPDKYLRANEDVLTGRVSSQTVAGAREREAGIWVQGDVEIEPGARVVAPVLLGAGVRVERGATVEASVLGPDAVVESGATTVGSVLHARSRIDHDAAAHDSVLGVDSVLGAGAVVEAQTLVGAGVVVPAGARFRTGRVTGAEFRDTLGA
jgi:NDP-sugar pyrophosphorylase family protein